MKRIPNYYAHQISNDSSFSESTNAREYSYLLDWRLEGDSRLMHHNRESAKNRSILNSIDCYAPNFGFRIYFGIDYLEKSLLQCVQLYFFLLCVGSFNVRWDFCGKIFWQTLNWFSDFVSVHIFECLFSVSLNIFLHFFTLPGKCWKISWYNCHI